VRSGPIAVLLLFFKFKAQAGTKPILIPHRNWRSRTAGQQARSIQRVGSAPAPHTESRREKRHKESVKISKKQRVEEGWHIKGRKLEKQSDTELN
jgi:hypothetical protein